jgi:hypothetical protein
MDGNYKMCQDSYAARIQDNLALSKMTPVWNRYLERFKSYSIFKSWPSEIQDGGWRPKWRNFSTSLGSSISIVKRYICALGDVCSICSFVTAHFVTYRHPDIRRQHNADSFIMNLRKNIKMLYSMTYNSASWKDSDVWFASLERVFRAAYSANLRFSKYGYSLVLQRLKNRFSTINQPFLNRFQYSIYQNDGLAMAQRTRGTAFI